MTDNNSQDLPNAHVVEPEQDTGAPHPTTQRVTIATQFTGPLPPPEILQRYNEATPEAADRILTMAEKQASHRQSIETRIINAESRDSLLGLIFGFLIGLIIISWGGYCIAKGFPVSGSLLSLSGLSSLVGTFIYGSKTKRQVNEQFNTQEPRTKENQLDLPFEENQDQ